MKKAGVLTGRSAIDMRPGTYCLDSQRRCAGTDTSRPHLQRQPQKDPIKAIATLQLSLLGYNDDISND